MADGTPLTLPRWVNLPGPTVEALSDPAHYWPAAGFGLGFLP